MKRSTLIFTILTAAGLVLSGCATKAGAQAQQPTQASTAGDTTTAPTPASILPAVGGANSGSAQTTGNLDAVAALENSIQQIYQQVNPSVVNIHVLVGGTSQTQSGQNQNPFSGNPQQSPFGEALGSGFVWDKQGYIVTNNHVVESASSVDVIFSDGLTVPAKVVGTDPDADLAVIQVNVPADRLQPITLADSTKVKVGQLAVAIGNPFGQQGSMSVGFVSGLGRELPVGGENATLSATGSYIIPDIIQTDAPINPGNSGGVLVDDKGMVLGVTAAIATNSGTGSGVGFVIPSVIVQKVVPALIKNGSYQHPWVGISGTSMTPELAKPMGLNSDQRGALVVSVTAGSPAAQAGLQASNNTTNVNGQQLPVGGDVIVSIDGNPVKMFDDLMTYLARNTNVGQKVTLGILRNGKAMNVDLSLGARPATNSSASTQLQNPFGQLPQIPNLPQQPQQTPQQPQTASGGWLGIAGYTLNANIDQAMSLPDGQQGVLVVRVQQGSPAENAGLQSGSQSYTDNGNNITIGGDVITAVDGQAVTSIDELRSILSQDKPGQKVTLTVLRNGTENKVSVTLGTPAG